MIAVHGSYHSKSTGAAPDGLTAKQRQERDELFLLSRPRSARQASQDKTTAAATPQVLLLLLQHTWVGHDVKALAEAWGCGCAVSVGGEARAGQPPVAAVGAHRRAEAHRHHAQVRTGRADHADPRPVRRQAGRQYRGGGRRLTCWWVCGREERTDRLHDSTRAVVRKAARLSQGSWTDKPKFLANVALREVKSGLFVAVRGDEVRGASSPPINHRELPVALALDIIMSLTRRAGLSASCLPLIAACAGAGAVQAVQVLGVPVPGQHHGAAVGPLTPMGGPDAARGPQGTSETYLSAYPHHQHRFRTSLSSWR